MISTPDKSIFDAGAFAGILGVERKRTDRSQRSFLLMLIDLKKLLQDKGQKRDKPIKSIVKALQYSIRQTDMIGWYQNHTIIGIIFTELSKEEALSVNKILGRVTEALHAILTSRQMATLTISTYLYPPAELVWPEPEISDKFYPDLNRYKLASFVKRILDVIGSVLLIGLFSPMIVFIGIVVKLTSKGSILFRQKRIGQFGRQFNFLKFRSMYTHADSFIHQQYIHEFIRQSKNGTHETLKQDGLFKLSKDPRITPLGHFLRKTSLDELPQLLNVLTGSMSLVGPRPPIPYEIEHYDLWHRRRVLEAKPGITGLWQVKGRSRTTFDDMVRLDLRYIDAWCLQADLTLLLRTPWTVIKCEGAR